MFADDTRILRKIENQSDLEDPQKDLQNVYDCQEDNNI